MVPEILRNNGTDGCSELDAWTWTLLYSGLYLYLFFAYSKVMLTHKLILQGY